MLSVGGQVRHLNERVFLCCSSFTSSRARHHRFGGRFVSSELAGYAALVQDDHSISKSEDLGQLRRNEDDRQAVFGQLINLRVNLLFRAHVDTSRWFVEKQHTWIRQ